MTLSFIPTNRRQAIFVIFIAATVCVFSCTFKGQMHRNMIDQYYKLVCKGEASYTLILYDGKNNVVSKETYPVEPLVNPIGNSIIEIRISLGSSNAYVHYYNTATQEVSDVFYNPRYIGNRIIAYREDDNLIITDAFDKNILYKVITRDFSPTAVPAHSILETTLLEDGNIEIEYLKGEEYDSTIEIININK